MFFTLGPFSDQTEPRSTRQVKFNQLRAWRRKCSGLQTRTELLTCAEMQGVHVHYGHGDACEFIFPAAFFGLPPSSEELFESRVT